MFRYDDDVKRIQRVAAAHGVHLQFYSAKALWDEESDSMCAGWLFLPESDDDLWETVRHRLHEVLR